MKNSLPRFHLALVLAFCCPVHDEAQASGATWNDQTEERITSLAVKWWLARPATRFEEWDVEKRARLTAMARELGELPEGKLERVVELLWEPVATLGPGIPKVEVSGSKRGQLKARRPKWMPAAAKRRRKNKTTAVLDTPAGEAWFYADDPGGAQTGLILGLHGDGVGADEPRGIWRSSELVGFYPQEVFEAEDSWNTVRGERFLLTLLEVAKAHYGVDPDRIFVMGSGMGGTGSWFMAGRHADLFAGAAPCAGVLIASPKSQVASKGEVRAVQHGLIPNVRNLAMYYYIGLDDSVCMPGTYLFVADRLAQMRAEDRGGYELIRFRAHENLDHFHPPGEPEALLDWLPKQLRDTFPETVVWEATTDPFPQPEAGGRVERIPKSMFYWIGCAAPEDRQLIRASIDKTKNRIILDVKRRSTGTKGITLYLNPQMIHVSRTVTVTDAGGKELYSGKPTPDLWTVLQTLDARVDRRMVFDRRIEL